MSYAEYFGKVIIVGDQNVGKTTLSMCKLKQTVSASKNSNIAAWFKYYCTVGDKKLCIEVWDTAGQERNRSLTKHFYRGANCILIVFDVTNEHSFDNVSMWNKLVKETLDASPPVVLVANKVDLIDGRMVSRSSCLYKAKQINGEFVETSALYSTNVEELFTLAARLVFRYKYGVKLTESVQQSTDKNTTGSKKKFSGVEVVILSDLPKEDMPKRNGCKCS